MGHDGVYDRLYERLRKAIMLNRVLLFIICLISLIAIVILKQKLELVEGWARNTRALERKTSIKLLNLEREIEQHKHWYATGEVYYEGQEPTTEAK